MPVWRRLHALWRNLALKRTVEDDLDCEVRSYRDMLEDEKLAAGADPQKARREALLELGGAEQVKEAVREIRAGATVEAIASDLRQSVRGLRRNPDLTTLAIMILALGMGASTAVFSIFYASIVQPLPFRDSDRIVQLWETRHGSSFDRASFTEANFWDVRARNRVFQEMGAYHYNEANLTGIGPAERVVASWITAGFFRTLGVSPVLGRDFSYDEDREGFNNHVAILGHAFWMRRFGGSPSLLGKTLRLDDRVYTVIGVLPAGQPWINDQVYIPFGYRSDADRGSFEFEVIGRLKSGVSMETVRSDLRRVASDLARSYPKHDKDIGFRLASSNTWIASSSTRLALWVLLAAVSFLLLIACMNIANLMLARGTARQRGIAIRTALGAGRGRLARFVMMESLLISGFGAMFGIVLAYAALQLTRSLEISGMPRLSNAVLNSQVLGCAALVAILTGVLSGLAPALQAPVRHIATALRDGDRQTGSRRQGRLRSALVTAEVALSFLLLVGAGLMMRSFAELMNVDRGFHTENRLVFSISMPSSYWQMNTGKQFLDRFFERLSRTPDVIAAGAVSDRPVEGGNPGMTIDSESRFQEPVQRAAPWAGWRIVAPGYFRAIGLPLVHGRVFNEHDQSVWSEPGQPPPPRHVIISERLAKLIFPNQDPIGRNVLLWKGQSNKKAAVVGVVADSLERGLTSGPTLTVYLPYGRDALTTEFVVHTRGNPRALTPIVRSIVASLDPDLPNADVRTFEEVVDRSVAPERFNAILLTVFSGIALLLATAGIYGVLSYSMGRRTSEIGLRMALGASAGSILRMTLIDGLRPALPGIALGAIGAWWLSRYFVALLFGIKPLDFVTFAVVAALLLATALAASYMPGRRAMQTDVMTALRVE